MSLSNLCPPAIVYIVFTAAHILVATFEGDFKGALLQSIIGVMMILLLQFLCLSQLGILSWIIVFLPFIFYTYMMIILYNIFGIDGVAPKNKE